MCGFVAQLGDRDISKAMAALSHRGTRQRVEHVSCGTVGHVRLPIVGLGEENDQPVLMNGRAYAFVGEILDFRDTHPHLACDAVLAAELWEENGPSGLKDRDGFWSVAMIDPEEESLHLLCDYLAQKPTYYRVDVRAAASEPEALVTLGAVTPDEVYLASVVKWGYCPETWRTPYHEVSKVLPGQHVVIRSDGQCTRRDVDPLKPLVMRPENLKTEIELAVERRVLSSDVDVAVLVSGGLDSSIVYTLARRYGKVRPYYAANGADLEELAAVDVVTKPDRATMIEWGTVPLERAFSYMQEPVDLGSLIPQVALSDAIDENVCLTGDGADELFGGYGRAQRYDSQASDVWHELVAYHLPRLDRVMMRNLVEVRSPFLARRVAGAALALPRKDRTNKQILRDIFRDDLPPHVADMPKKPLRTREVETDRESRSRFMVQMLRHRRGWI